MSYTRTGKVEVKFHITLTSVLDRGKQSDNTQVVFIPGKEDPV